MTVCDGCPCLTSDSNLACGLTYDVEYDRSIHAYTSRNCRLIKVETVDSAFYPDKRMGGEYEEDE